MLHFRFPLWCHLFFEAHHFYFETILLNERSVSDGTPFGKSSRHPPPPKSRSTEYIDELLSFLVDLHFLTRRQSFFSIFFPFRLTFLDFCIVLFLRLVCRYIKMSSPYLNNMIIIGCLLTYTSVILLGLDSRLTSEAALPYICTARIWTLMAGFTLAFGSMFSKTWRVHSIFTDVKLNKKVVLFFLNPSTLAPAPRVALDARLTLWFPCFFLLLQPKRPSKIINSSWSSEFY